ncbi:MAG: sugar phosphate isomerase/epimerase [Spirochaetaceae bacterium]|nr:MAG: sugar phosphate isomerase/epimerase [Spirochaetaceae bacterium]
MTITGIADEGSPELTEQIRIHRTLGWNTLELRLIGKSNVCAIDDGAFDLVYRTLQEEQMEVICFASAIANWARPITSDFQVDVEELNTAIPRMRRLGTRFIRVMSYPNDGLPEEQWRKEAIRRMKELARIAADGEVVLVHENCSGWGGMSAENQKILLEEVHSPNLQIVFDTGNPVGEGHPPEETWDFYQTALPFIKHVHIKDCRKNQKGEIEYTYPGEGQSMVRRILKSILDLGYTGAFSIEPHITAQIHLGTSSSGREAEEIYLEYGRRTNAMLAELAGQAG